MPRFADQIIDAESVNVGPAETRLRAKRQVTMDPNGYFSGPVDVSGEQAFVNAASTGFKIGWTTIVGGLLVYWFVFKRGRA